MQATSKLLNDGGICVLWTPSFYVFTFLLIVNFVSVLTDLDKSNPLRYFGNKKCFNSKALKT